jgi:mannose-1-phosphate guanylyltransferase
LALACSVIRARENGNDALMAVLTADHFIGNTDAFRADVSRALTFASTYDALVTIGIPPTRPETGYGYIHVGEPTVVSGVSHVVEFKEKPDLTTALEYVRSGRYVWNSGMFFWRTEALRSAMLNVLPDVGNAIDGLTADLAANDAGHMSEMFHALPDISIDYGVMERSTNVHVVPATFPWDDVGSWDALERMRPLDNAQNVVDGVVTVVDTEGSIIVNAHGSAHTVTTVGLRDTVVVVTPDATMVCPKDRAQDVKRIVTTLRAQDRHDIL